MSFSSRGRLKAVSLVFATVLVGITYSDCLAQSRQAIAQYELPVYQEANVPKETLALASDLSRWVETILNQHHAKAAYIARNGTALAERFDKTGMGHGGLVVWNAQTSEWVVFNWMSNKDEPGYNRADPQAKVYISTIQHFFNGMRSNRKEALVLIPEAGIQQELVKLFASGRYQTLTPTYDYDFLARADDDISFNCVKWSLLMTLAAAHPQRDSTSLLKTMDTVYQKTSYSVSFWQRPFLAQIAGIRMKRIPWSGFRNQRILSTEGLYYLDLFQTKTFYSGRAL